MLNKDNICYLVGLILSGLMARNRKVAKDLYIFILIQLRELFTIVSH